MIIRGPKQFSGGGSVSGLMGQARDASGNVVPGLFRMEYDDGTYSQAADVRTIDALRQSSLAGETPINTINEAKYLEQLEPLVLKNTDNLSVVDMKVGPNESIGNDMVMITFPDGTKGQTQKALYEAANSLGAFEGMETQKDFADWHLNEWAGKVVSDPEYIAAHDQFNTNQIAYNNALIGSDPKIGQARMAFVQQHAPDNQAAIDANQALLDQIYGAEGAGIAGAGVNNMGAENTVADPFNNNYMPEYPIYNYSEGMGDDDAEIIDEFDYEKMIEELNLPSGSMILRTPKQFNVGGAVTPNIDRFMQSLGA